MTLMSLTPALALLAPNHDNKTPQAFLLTMQMYSNESISLSRMGGDGE